MILEMHSCLQDEPLSNVMVLPLLLSNKTRWNDETTPTVTNMFTYMFQNENKMTVNLIACVSVNQLMIVYAMRIHKDTHTVNLN